MNRTNPGYVIVPTADLTHHVLRAGLMVAQNMRSESSAVLTVNVRQLDEGCFLATSEGLPGLTVEADSREDIIDEVPVVASDLYDVMGVARDKRPKEYAFIFAQ